MCTKPTSKDISKQKLILEYILSKLNIHSTNIMNLYKSSTYDYTISPIINHQNLTINYFFNLRFDIINNWLHKIIIFSSSSILVSSIAFIINSLINLASFLLHCFLYQTTSQPVWKYCIQPGAEPETFIRGSTKYKKTVVQPLYHRAFGWYFDFFPL